jgi:hypothetical protein
VLLQYIFLDILFNTLQQNSFLNNAEILLQQLQGHALQNEVMYCAKLFFKGTPIKEGKATWLLKYWENRKTEKSTRKTNIPQKNSKLMIRKFQFLETTRFM